MRHVKPCQTSRLHRMAVKALASRARWHSFISPTREPPASAEGNRTHAAGPISKPATCVVVFICQCSWLCIVGHPLNPSHQSSPHINSGSKRQPLSDSPLTGPGAERSTGAVQAGTSIPAVELAVDELLYYLLWQ